MIVALQHALGESGQYVIAGIIAGTWALAGVLWAVKR